MAVQKPHKQKKTILICPLDWGLGHASRDIVIIQKLLDKGFRVIIGADKSPLCFLQEEFPHLLSVKIPFVNIIYPKGKMMVVKMFFSLPKLLFGIFKEHQHLKKILEKQQIDIVISDNRFGLWNKKVFSVFITHQLEIQVPKFFAFIKPIINKINLWFISKYNYCWVPDLPNVESVAGLLSRSSKATKNTKYIGLLSRFQLMPATKKKYDIAVILSGPEPQRSIFEKLIADEIRQSNYKAVIVQGKPIEKNRCKKVNIDYINHLKKHELQQLILSSGLVISRSGYSSIMDYMKLKRNAILVPTQGQTEQEYLATRMKEKGWFYSMEQHEFKLQKAIKESKAYQVPDINTSHELLENEIGKLQEKLYLYQMVGFK